MELTQLLYGLNSGGVVRVMRIVNKRERRSIRDIGETCAAGGKELIGGPSNGWEISG